MSTRLPTAEDLERLPLRAIVAYAARAARRIGPELQTVVADVLIQDVLRLVDSALTPESITGGDKTLVVVMAERLAAAFVEAPVSAQTVVKASLVFSLVQAALAAMHAVLAVDDPSNARRHIKRAAKCAQKAVCPVKSLNGNAVDLAIQAARRDYEVLLREYGEHEDVVLGEPVDCLDAE
jgi:hypothetical protein